MAGEMTSIQALRLAFAVRVRDARGIEQVQIYLATLARMINLSATKSIACTLSLLSIGVSAHAQDPATLLDGYARPIIPDWHS